MPGSFFEPFFVRLPTTAPRVFGDHAVNPVVLGHAFREEIIEGFAARSPDEQAEENEQEAVENCGGDNHGCAVGD